MATGKSTYSYADKNLHAAITSALEGDHALASFVMWYYSEGVRAHSTDGYYYRQIDAEAADAVALSRSKQMTRRKKMERLGLLKKDSKRHGAPVYPLKAGRLTYNLPKERDEDGNLIPLPKGAPKKVHAVRGGKYNVSYLNIDFRCERLINVIDPITKKPLWETFQERRYESVNKQLRKEAAYQAKQNKFKSERQKFKQLHEGLHARICEVCWFDNKPTKADAVKEQHKQVWSFLYNMDKQGAIALIVQQIETLWDIKFKRGKMTDCGLPMLRRNIKEGKSMEKAYEEWLQRGEQKEGEQLAQVHKDHHTRQAQLEKHEFEGFQSLLKTKLKLGFEQRRYVDALTLGGIDHNAKLIKVCFASTDHFHKLNAIQDVGKHLVAAIRETWGEYTYRTYIGSPPT